MLKRGEASEDLHSLIHHLAIISRVREAGPQKGRRGLMRTEEAELALTTSLLRRALSVVGVKAQARLLLGRLEVIGPGAAAAAGETTPSTKREFGQAREGLTFSAGPRAGHS